VEIRELTDLLESCIEDPSEGLPEDMFLFVSTITPMINVDLLIKDEENHTLLTWRDDGHYGPGWHIPGGVIRYRETISERIRAVAANELGTEVACARAPLAINEVIDPSGRARGHFISLLYECALTGSLDEGLRYGNGSPKPGEWAWHGRCPDNLIAVHEMYRGFV
jgi:ADP-ribose pyrophosphatase YjhB (NUDIX family)